jgi:hypothetical protein
VGDHPATHPRGETDRGGVSAALDREALQRVGEEARGLVRADGVRAAQKQSTVERCRHPQAAPAVVSTVNQAIVAQGSVLARVEFARPKHPGTTTVTLTPVFAFEPVFRYVDHDAAENWLVVGDAMREIGPDVAEAVSYVLPAHAHDTSSA